MKKLFTVPLLFLAVLSYGQSQITIGPKAGVALNSLVGSDVPDAVKSDIGYNAGAFLTYSSETHFGFTVEATYTRRGAKADILGETVHLKYNYLEVPILARYFFGNGTIRPSIFLGPSLNFLLSAKSGDEDVKSSTASFDFVGVVGAGVNIKTLENQWLNIDVRYNRGFISTGKEVNGETPKSYNQGAILAVGYGFGI